MARYRDNLRALLDALTPSVDRVLLVGLPAVGPAALTRDLKDVHVYEAAMADVATERGLPHVPLSNVLGADDLDPDGVHPNGRGHERIAAQVAAALGW